MEDTYIDPLIKRAVADAVMERASLELNRLLVELAAALDPFPNFMGVTTIQAIEVEPSGTLGSDNGCIVVCPDGKLRELVLRMVPGPFELGGVEQTDEMAELDLPPGEYVALAYAAVQELIRCLDRQRASQ